MLSLQSATWRRRSGFAFAGPSAYRSRAAHRTEVPGSLLRVSMQWLSYWRHVYRDEFLESRDALALGQRAFWFYHSAPFTEEVECFVRADSTLNLQRACSVGERSFRIVVRYRPQPETWLNRFGFFLPHNRGGTCRETCHIVPTRPSPHGAAARLGHLQRQVPSAAREVCPLRKFFAPDGAWIEVMRIAERNFYPHSKKREGGDLGCWFFAAPGSGIFVNVNRSLRVPRRKHLAEALNMTGLVSRPPIGREYFEAFPYAIDTLGICKYANALGYDSVQIWDEDARGTDALSRFPHGLPELTKLWEHEVVMCQPDCLAREKLDASGRDSRGPCTAVPLRTGVNATRQCACNDTQPVLNCDETAPGLPPAVGNRTEIVLQSSSWRAVRQGKECTRGRGPDHLTLEDIFPARKGRQG